MRHCFVLWCLILFAPACSSHRHGRRHRHVAPTTAGVHVRHAPPPAPKRVVVKTRRPGHNHVWVGGHYVVRRGRYAWVGGHWTRPPRSRAVWVAGRWR